MVPANLIDIRIVAVYLVYGLSFFTVGMVIRIQSKSDDELSLSASARMLGAFGVAHGASEFLDVANKALARILGLGGEAELTGKNILDFMAPEARDEARARFREEVCSGVFRSRIEVPIIRGDGRRGILEVHPSVPCQAAGASAWPQDAITPPVKEIS